jgi:cytoskeletal protein CcmA (bactofilin family)
MWKKDSEPDAAPQQRTDPAAPRQSAAPGAGVVPGTGPGASGNRAAIGRSITIRGDVTGDEDLLIQGRIEGSVDLEKHAVTVGPEGDVKASIRGRIVTIEGSVKGNLTATEQIILRSSARVQGDIAAPRVVLEDGANFRGGVDMGEPEGGSGGRSAGSTAGDRRGDAKGGTGGDARSGGRAGEGSSAAAGSNTATATAAGGSGGTGGSGGDTGAAGDSGDTADSGGETGGRLEKGKGSGAPRPQVAR